MLINPKYQQLAGTKDSYLLPDCTVKGVPSPVGGWDAVSPLSSMDPQYAPIMQNWVPRPGYLELRGGYNIWVSATSAPIETLMVWRGPDASQILYAAGGSTIMNVSLYGSVAVSVSALNSARWQYCNFTPAGGSSYIIACNGVDAVREFDGAVWTAPAITNVTPSSLVNVNVHKRRVWFVEIDSTKAWYLATDAITGPATRFDIGAFMTKGGYLVAMGTWTVDGGNGPDDLAVFISSQGQAIIYKGTDPGNVNAWALVGVFDLAIPLGYRCFGKIGSELGLITLEGLLPVSKSLPFDPSGVRSTAYTNRIQNAMLNAAYLGQSLFGWQLLSFPGQGLIVMNVPQAENQQQSQYVMNGISGAWTNFIGWNANCFDIYNNSLYFGDNSGNVNLGFAGSMDYDQPVIYDCQCAFNFFDEPGRIKNMTMCRPFILADGTVIPSIGVDVDFQNTGFAAPVTIINPSGAIWNTSLWDVGIWSVGNIATTDWLSAQAIGTALAIRIQVNLNTGITNSTISMSGQDIPFLRVNAFQAMLVGGGPV